ncbi:MAG: F0F1 ATP synthase subunit A [Myxococcota bacterium]
MTFASGFTWWHLIGIGQDFEYTSLGEQLLGPSAASHGFMQSLAGSWALAIVVVLFAVGGRLSLNAAKARPGVSKWYAKPGLGLLTAAEMIVEFWRSMMGGSLEKKDVRSFLPIVAAMFLYIFGGNIMGMIPGLLPPTENVHHNWAMSICVFLLFMTVGILRDPVSFIKHLAGPVWWLIPLIFGIEALGLIVRPATLTIRLTGNLFGDHTVFTIMSDMVPWLVPVPFLALALIVSFIQAFVFSLLTSIYISLSVPHHDEAH